MLSQKIHLYIIVVLTILLAGCSSGKMNPVNPGDFLSTLPVGVSDYSTDGTPYAGSGILGLFEINVNIDAPDAELIPIRSGASSDVLEVVDITNFLMIAPCTDCVDLAGISLDMDGNLVLSIGIRHPFETGDPLKPISGRNRADLHVFNVEGIIVSETTGDTFGTLGVTLSNAGLQNADGFSGYLDAALEDIYPTDADVHPYITHFDDYTVGNYDPANPMGFESVTTPPPSGYLVMAMGSDYDYQDYVFNPVGGGFSFIYAVGCTYGVSADSKIQRFNPIFRCPQFNKKAASEISILILNNMLNDMDPLSSADIEVHVVDINHWIAVGEGFDQMRVDSSVDDIFIEIPVVMTDMLVLDGNNPTSGTGHSPLDPLIYTGIVTNSALAPEGEYTGLVKVTDNYVPGLNESPLLNEMDGISRVDPVENPLTGLFDITEFAAYQTFSIDVVQGNNPPTAVLTSNPDPATITEGNSITLDASGSSDAEDDIADMTFAYIWDYDGDPSSFDIPDYEAVGETSVDTDPYDTAGDFTAGLKVTDTGGLYDIDTIEVTVLEIPELVVFANYNQMYTCKPDHTNRNYIGPGRYPCISQSNNVIVYCDSSNFNIRAMDVDGTNDRLVIAGYYVYPSVSANGSVVTFYDTSYTTNCFRCDIDGSNFAQLNPNDGVSWRYAQISGNGAKIVMLRYEYPRDIYVCDGDGSNLTLVKSDGGYPQITYDAGWIFYEDAFQIRRIKPDGTQDQLVIGQSATSRYCITPDGTKVTYCQYYSGNGNDLGVYDLVTSQETRLTFTNRNAGEKTITVDGKWIIADSFAVGGLYSITTDGMGSILEWNEGDDPSAHGCIPEHY